MNPTSFKRLFAASLLVLLTTGCGVGTLSTTGGSPVTVAPATTTSGVVMGGQQPVAGITLQLYTAGTTGYGSAATPLGASFVTTPSGNFTLPGFTCPSTSSLTYLVGTGGQPIAATSTASAVTNNNLAMMVGLGACSSVGTTFINMNEVTTVASVWSLSAFMTGITNIGAPPSNFAGIQNAFAAISKVADTTNGHVSGPLLPTGAVLPINKIDTLADMLEQCVNSSGGVATDSSDGQTSGTGCGKLFYLTGGAATTDTITAAMYIAQHPTLNQRKLNLLRSTSPVFVPVIDANTPPNDWSIAITYSGGGLSTPQGVTTDQAGNVWVANSGNNSVSEFASSGAAVSGAAGFTAGGINVPYALAADQSGNLWVANSGNNTVTNLNASGASGTAYSGNGLNVPKGIAVDARGNVFLSNSGANSFSGFTKTGTPIVTSPFSGGTLGAPIAIAVNPY